jgi:hypothetical protein
LGSNALYNNINGDANLALGDYSLYSNTSGRDNVAVGSSALYSNVGGLYNVAVGVTALIDNTSGSENTAVGLAALKRNLDANYNTALGSFALASNEFGNKNTSVGRLALEKSSGNENTAIGHEAGLYDLSGNYNTFLGAHSGIDLSANIHTYSTSVGYGATVTASSQIMMGENYETVVIAGTLNNSVGYKVTDISGGSLPDGITIVLPRSIGGGGFNGEHTLMGYYVVEDASFSIFLPNPDKATLTGKSSYEGASVTFRRYPAESYSNIITFRVYEPDSQNLIVSSATNTFVETVTLSTTSYSTRFFCSNHHWYQENPL